MSLKTFFPEQFEAIRRFLEAPDQVVRRVVIDPEMEEMFLKAMGRMQEEEGFFHIFLLHQGPCTDANAYFEALTSVAEEAFEDARAELAGVAGRIDMLRRTADRVAAPRHFHQIAEAMAEGMPDECGCLTFILAPQTAPDPAIYARTMRFLAETTVSEWLRFIMLDLRQAPVLNGLEDLPGVSSQQFYLGPDEIERRVAEDLRADRLEPKERRQYLAMLAGFHFTRGEHEDAARLHRQAMKEAGADADPGERATTLYNFGNTCAAAKRFPEAVKAYSEAAELCIAHKNAGLAPFVYINLGSTLHKAGDFPQAYASLKVARDMFRAQGHLPGEAHVCDTLAELYHADGDDKNAVKSWAYAHRLFGRVSARHFADLRQTGQDGIEMKLKRIGMEPKRALAQAEREARHG
ncbi:MAG: tetratricopeptide repeat protein [Pseudomonadota bacterium]